MDTVEEQRSCIKFCVKNGKTGAETLQMLRTSFSDDCLSQAVVYQRVKRFKDGRESLKDDPRQGRPSTARNEQKVAQVREKICADRCLTIREIAEEVNVSCGSCQAILSEDLAMRHVAAKFVPRLLSDDQKSQHIEVCEELKQSVEIFVSRIITGDETWVYGYDPETKLQSSQWRSSSSPRPKKARQVRSNVETMLMVFFDIQGLMHCEFVPAGQTVNQHYYKEVLLRLREKVRRKWSQLFQSGRWLLHHDNAPAHIALSIQEFLVKKKIPVVPHPPYSPDLAPCDFFLFPRIKMKLKGRRFDDDTIKMNTTRELNVLSHEDFQRCF
jgi:histone-lysine N-methyltransferase SETMAR